jgi:hypothetical protein
MKTPRLDFYSLDNAVAFGVRPQVTTDDRDLWEVYVKLTNGSRVTVAKDGTKPQAANHLRRLLQRMGMATPQRTLIETLDGACLDAEHIIRIYVDAQADGFVAIAEDSLGEGHRIAEGDKDDCREAVLDTVQMLAVLKHLHEEEPD